MLNGKVAVVTGSTSGIGLGIAEALAKAGCSVLLNGFGDKDQVNHAMERVSAYGTKVAYSAADVTKQDQIENMLQKASDDLGDILIAVNNAGIQHVDFLEDFPIEKWDQVIATNLSSVFHLSRILISKMKAKSWGRVINIASAHGLVASAKKSAYVAAKHGVVGFTKSVALETAGTGITCNSICPGWVLTPLVEKQIAANAERDSISFDQAKINLLSEKQPSKEFVTVQELGDLTVFLCSESARSITGASISVDGGWTAQ